MVSRLVSLAWLAALGLVASAGCSSSSRVDVVGVGGASGVAGSVSSAGGSAVPVSRPCAESSQCDASSGTFCVEGTCRLACSTHFDCQGYGECKTGVDTDGNTGLFCELGDEQPAGQFFARCPKGNSDCDTDNGFFCVGAGSEDLDAYCTKDCTRDSSCAAGFSCTPLVRVTCGNDCGIQGDPKDRSCIPSDQIGAGKDWTCGSRGATRNACRPRKFCSECETDSDCLAAPNQLCAKDESGTKICTTRCDPKRPSCPWGNAAKCGVWDADVGAETCSHRFGQCTGTGKGCEPCLKDADCGDNSVCTSSSFTGERWCVDLKVRCSCADSGGTPTCLGGGCPKSPSGLDMLCVDGTPSTPNSGYCAGSNTVSSLLASPQTGCWPN